VGTTLSIGLKCPGLNRGSLGFFTLNKFWLYYRFCQFILPIFPVRGRGVCSLVNKETLLELRSKLRLDALPVTTIEFSGIWTHNSLRKSCILTTKPRLLHLYYRLRAQKIRSTIGSVVSALGLESGAHGSFPGFGMAVPWDSDCDVKYKRPGHRVIPM